ncbi:SPOR domain-containing protein [Sphingomonas sp. SUN039]|uniref:SPOR domain-containing protein n=1 Tax=Sphingomonas sp. SUN039 TaxID=2937787 RepID=UPI00216435D9|nr:SPOR domain-containing protein [Sphingomonas sp. SUN039]UVO54455.1 SPOR domain-containing protein [Sphingomonas sp. SUN039]
MSDIERDAATDEDRLPWLEAVDDEDADEGVSPGKMMALIVAALVALGIVIGGVWLMRSKGPANATDPTLIAAAEGDYKVKPDAPGGMKVEGKGDSAFATSEGAEATGKIDTNALPEAPVKGVKGVTVADAAGKPSANTTVAVPKAGGQLVAKTPVVVAPVRTGAGGTMVQLGAFGSEAKAGTAWSTLASKYAYVAPLKRQIVAAEVGGSTVYRLRAEAGGQAAAVCQKLKAAGENCIQVN